MSVVLHIYILEEDYPENFDSLSNHISVHAGHIDLMKRGWCVRRKLGLGLKHKPDPTSTIQR